MMSGMTAAPAPPNWATLKQDLLCPLCAYNLRGLIDPLCPECGYRFEWRILLDETLRLHPYLFEHHPERPISAFTETLLGSARPRRFWSMLRPQQKTSVRRLLLYWIGCVLPVL